MDEHENEIAGETMEKILILLTLALISIVGDPFLCNR